MTKQEAPLREVLKGAKNELDEARRELERAREQIRSQRQSLQQELDGLLKIRDHAAADKTAIQKLTDEFRGDWDSLQAGLLEFGQTAQELQKRQEEIMQLVKSKQDDLKATLKNLDESIMTFRNLAAELTGTLGELQSDQAKFGSTTAELDHEIRETATGGQRVEELLKSIAHGLKKNQERLQQLNDVASKIQASISSAGAGVQEIEGCFKTTGDASQKLASALSDMGKSVELVSSLLGSETKKLQDIQEKQTSLHSATLDTQKLIKDVEVVSRGFRDSSKTILERVQAQEGLLNEVVQVANETQATVGSTQAIGQEIEKSLGKLEATSTQTETALNELRKSAEQASGSLEAQEKRLEEIQKKQKSFDSQVAEAAHSVEAIVSVNDRIADRSDSLLHGQESGEKCLAELAEAVKNAQATLTHADAILDKVEESRRTGEEASRQLKESLTSLHGSAEALNDQMDSLAERLRDAKAKDEEELRGISESLRQDFDKFAASMKLVFDGFDVELTRARGSRAEIADALGRSRQELATSLGLVDRLSKESTKEYAEAAGLLAATIKEIGAQRDEMNASAQRLKATAEQLQAQRMALDERLGALRAERERRAAARKRRVCPSCSRKVSTTDTFCDRCGASLV